MNYSLLFIAIAATGLAALPAVSQAAEDQSGFFVNGGMGRSSNNETLFNDSETAYDVDFGYRWGWFGVEVGYVDVGKFTTSLPFATTDITTGTTTSGVVNLGARLHGFTAGVNAHYDFTQNWYVSGRAGAFQWHGTQDNILLLPVDPGSPVVVVRRKDSKADWYAGAGFGYDFSNKFGIGLNYDHYDASSGCCMNLTTSVWSINAEYRF